MFEFEIIRFSKLLRHFKEIIETALLRDTLINIKQMNN